MSHENVKNVIPGLEAAGDLSNDQHKFGVINSSGQVEVVSAIGAPADGVIQDDPSAQGRSVALAPSGISKVVVGAAVAKGDLVMANAVGKAITAALNATAASKVGGAETYDLVAGDTVVLDVDNVGNATATFDAAAGTITDTTSYAVADQDGLTSIITIDGGDAQTITFAGATTTALQIAAQINDQLVGGSAVVSGGQVVVSSDKQGTDSSVAAAAGTGNLTWAAAVAGTGDVADINAVTAAEVKTVVEADTTATVSVSAGVFTISSPTTGVDSELEFVSGDAITPLGLSVEVIDGARSSSYFCGRALEAASNDGEIIEINLDNSGLVA